MNQIKINKLKYNVSDIVTSGSGKSFFTNELISSYLVLKPRKWIIDVGESYKSICDILDGKYITLSETSSNMDLGKE